jgi:hypothetical protein
MDRDETLKVRVATLENKIKDRVKHVRMEDRAAHARIDKLESEIARDRMERQDFKWNEKEDKEYRTQRAWKRR